jgi:hypothetical protein
MKLKSMALAVIVAATAATPAFAYSWSLLGARDVRDRTDHDAIGLPGNREFNRIRLCVYRNPVHFYDVHVRYRNGGVQEVPVRLRINPGQCTRAINLNGANRNIDRIDMTYEETSFRHRTATVRVFGE